jgi:hypothetical protein
VTVNGHRWRVGAGQSAPHLAPVYPLDAVAELALLIVIGWARFCGQCVRQDRIRA